MAVRFPIDSPILILVGPTAIGKTDLSIELASRFHCEIISMDSMQVYRYMDIGTAKIKEEEKKGIVHHLIDIVDPDVHYDAGCFTHDSLEAVQAIRGRGNNILITGGTGLYLKALTDGLMRDIPSDEKIREKLKKQLFKNGADDLFDELQQYDPTTAARIHKNDHYRLVRALEIFKLTGKSWAEHIDEQKFEKGKRFTNCLEIGLTCDRQNLYERIDRRTIKMMEVGLEDEVSGLLAMGYHRNLKSMKSIGYRHMVNYFEGKWSREEAFNLLARDTRHYAKRQYTWFNKSDSIRWFDVSDRQTILKTVSNWFHRQVPI